MVMYISTKPNIYLDIDGVLLANERNLAIGAAEFIKYATEHFDVYWLTTHCMDGNPTHAIDYVQRAADEDLRPYLQKIKPTTWSVAKTEAIDFSKPFLWFDDDCYDDERTTLQDNGALDSWIEINLSDNPERLVFETKLLREPVLIDKIRSINRAEKDATLDDYLELVDLLFAVERYFIPTTEDDRIPIVRNTHGASGLPIFTTKKLMKDVFSHYSTSLYMLDVEDLIFDNIESNPEISIIINPNNEDKSIVMNVKASVFVEWKKRHLQIES